eukprot:jgi/Astpho2/3254/e_gw1.00052.79.1_t
MQVHASVPAAFHMTVFMTSQPSDPRPDPFNPEGGGMNPGSPPVPIPAPSAACLQQELAAFKGLAAVSGPPPSIMHMTLARVLRVQQLTPEQRQSIQEACSLWTDKLRGQVFRPEVLTHTQEHQFTTVEGIRTPFPFATKAPIKS